MTVARWQRPDSNVWGSFRGLSTLRDEIDRLFESPFTPLADGTQPFLSGWMPALDLYEDKNNVIVKAELPGMRKEDIDISLHEGVLTLSGERKDEQKYEGAETYRAERFVGRFHRAVALPSPVDADKVKASYQNGILTVTLPKTEEAKPKQIPVNIN